MRGSDFELGMMVDFPTTVEVFGAPIKSSAQVAATQGSSLEEELIMLRAEVWVGRMCGKAVLIAELI